MMKPIKNRIYCKEIGRLKILFITQKKADNFIRFNSEEIQKDTGYSPKRSYFCQVCGGWHVTHREYFDEEKPTIIDKVLSTYRMSYDSDIRIMEQLEKMLFQIKKLLKENDLDSCNHILKLAEKYMNDVNNTSKQTNRYMHILHRYNLYLGKVGKKVRTEISKNEANV